MANRFARHLQYAVMALALLSPLGQFAEAQQSGRQRARWRSRLPIWRSGASPGREDAARSAQPGLPADKTTQHKLTGGGREIAFAATAGTIPLFDERSGAVTASLAYIAFTRTDTGGSRERPVTFVWNGGPGYASAWLNLGAMGRGGSTWPATPRARHRLRFFIRTPRPGSTSPTSSSLTRRARGLAASRAMMTSGNISGALKEMSLRSPRPSAAG